MKTNAAISDAVLVAVEIRGPVVGGQQQIEISIAIEVAIGQPASHFRLREAFSRESCDIAKLPAAGIQEKLRRLRVSDISPNVAHGFLDVAVDHREVEPAVEIGIKKNAAESQRGFRGQADTSGNRNIVVGAGAHCAI